MQNTIIRCPRCSSAVTGPFEALIVCDTCKCAIATVAEIRYAAALHRSTPPPAHPIDGRDGESQQASDDDESTGTKARP